MLQSCTVPFLHCGRWTYRALLVPGSLQPRQFTEGWGKGEHTLHGEHSPKAQLLSSSLYLIADALTQPGPDAVCSIQKPDVMQLCGEGRTLTGREKRILGSHNKHEFLPCSRQHWILCTKELPMMPGSEAGSWTHVGSVLRGNSRDALNSRAHPWNRALSCRL